MVQLIQMWDALDFKVEMKFGHQTKFVTKVKLEEYSKPAAAAFLDSIFIWSILEN